MIPCALRAGLMCCLVALLALASRPLSAAVPIDLSAENVMRNSFSLGGNLPFARLE